MAKKKKYDDSHFGPGLEKELDEIMGVDTRRAQGSAKGKSSASKKKKKKADAVPEEEGMKKGPIIAAVCGLTLLAVGGVGAAYLVKAQDYKENFLDQTFINGRDVSGKTVDQVEQEIKEEVETYDLEITFKDGDHVSINSKDISYTYISSSEVATLMSQQKMYDWFRQNKVKKEYTVSSEVTFDKEQLAGLVSQAQTLQAINQVEPVDAYIDYTDKTYVIVPEVEGNKIDQTLLLEACIQAVETASPAVNAEETGAYILPAVTKEDEKLNRQVEQLNTLAGADLTVKLPVSKEVTIDGELLYTWLEQDEEGNYTMPEDTLKENITAMVKEWAKLNDTYGEEMTFKATSGKEAKVQSIEFGWQINQKKTVEKVINLIKEAKKESCEPEYTHKMKGTGNNGFGDTYIEADLTAQHVYFYKEGKVIWESDCVSGKMTADRATPTGIYQLDDKQLDRVLRGRKYYDGTYSYESKVKYWMPFKGGYGFHDASWRGKFGGTIYNYSGSHGCINLPTKKAEALYEIIDKETPIVIFFTHDAKIRAAEPFVDPTIPKEDDEDEEDEEDDSVPEAKPDNNAATEEDSTDESQASGTL